MFACCFILPHWSASSACGSGMPIVSEFFFGYRETESVAYLNNISRGLKLGICFIPYQIIGSASGENCESSHGLDVPQFIGSSNDDKNRSAARSYFLTNDREGKIPPENSCCDVPGMAFYFQSQGYTL